MPFVDMNEILMERLEAINAVYVMNIYGLRVVEIREDFSINVSIIRGSSTHDHNMKIPTLVVDIQNC